MNHKFRTLDRCPFYMLHEVM